MFTGIVSDIGSIRAIVKQGDTRIEIKTSYDTAGIDLGASICCSGACMTVVQTGPDWYAVEASQETLSKTTLGSWQVGTSVNLERALKAGDELGGHIVSGHVDGTATVENTEIEGDSLRIIFRAPDNLKQFVAAKGSITLDGVSLTVNEVEGALFGVNLIAHTQKMTTLGNLSPGCVVNVEIDMLARYVSRLLENK